MPRDDAPLADPDQPGAIPNDQPTDVSGLPDEKSDDVPLGVEDSDPDGEGDAPRGEDAMPGIPTDEEPQTDG
jgi:hypothetical protein